MRLPSDPPLLQVQRVKLNSCLLIVSFLMGLRSEKDKKKQKNNDILLLIYEKQGSDDDSGKNQLAYSFKALQKTAVSFSMNKKIKA